MKWMLCSRPMIGAMRPSRRGRRSICEPLTALKMTVVIDTNVLLMSLPRRSKFRPIFDGLLKGAYELVITEDILQEYIEIIRQKTTGSIAQNLAELFNFLTRN